ncbi:MAG: tetratricopeptide repeat protein, partial [Smithella sp.]|nr:tetratricopeptide repeat protein [Smithella sp.]
NAGGYHMTNLIFHILSTLMLFWLFHRMTRSPWKSAFVAGFFALHPLHVESVAWIAERKDVLSAFFWMLTLCLYVYYTEKPALKRYLLVLLAFVLALMSKPMVVTLPVMMILLDYWPLNRFTSMKRNPVVWQLKEKLPLFVLSAVNVAILFHPTQGEATYLKLLPFSLRIANAPVAFMTYLEKTFWPQNMAFLYPFPAEISLWHVSGASLLIIIITLAVVVMARRLPYLFVGWFWYAITIAPVIGIIQISISAPYAMADRYHYLPSIGLAVMLAWGIPHVIPNKKTIRTILLPAATAFLIIMAMLAWKQCGYWTNNFTLFSRALQVTKDNYVAHNNLGLVLFNKGRLDEAMNHYNRAIDIKDDYINAYYNRGVANFQLGLYQPALQDFDQTIRLKPNFAAAYNNRGAVHVILGQNSPAIEDYSEAIKLKKDYADAYFNRGFAYNKLGQHQLAVEDFSKAIQLRPDYLLSYYGRIFAYKKLGQHLLAEEDVKQARRLRGNKPLNQN